MPIYTAPVQDVLFLLSDVFAWERYSNLPGFAEADLATVESILTEAADVCQEVLQPLNRIGDEQGCRRRPDGSVETPQGFRDAYRTYAKGGWIGLAAPSELGGQGLPYTLAAIVNYFSAAANMAFTMYPGLTQTAIATIVQHAPDHLKRLLLPPMCAGTWSGTMNLTEPQCGTDLGLVKTKAVPLADGTYALSGQKIFISAGEHDLCENIIHLVLARIEGAGPGTRGLSLFVVPKIDIAPDGSLGAPNRLSCGAIERKMGIHGNATCVMNYDGARGWLIGAENRGLHAMFTMMNEARLGVATQGLAQSDVAYQNAAAYARERLQGRAFGGAKAPDKPADPIIVHPDIRRMLLTIRAFNEAARALSIYASLQADLVRSSTDEATRSAAEDRLGLLTPILKGVCADLGFENTVLAQQIFGGHGYIAETGVEQFVRDARIAMIYEGANGIQALDLVGRKLPKDGGRAMRSFLDEIAALLKQSAQNDALKAFAAALQDSVGHLQQATLWLMQNALGDLDNAGAAAYDYMHLFGQVGLGYMWLRIAAAAQARQAGSSDGSEAEEMETKLRVARFYFERILPETAVRLTRIRAGAAALMALSADQF
jgi:acyl-CoA dehydrogenase